MYFYKKGLAFLLGLALVFSVASVTQAAGVTFDLLFSKYDVALDDITDIDFMTFYGTATIFQTPVTATSGTFEEDGVVTFQSYNDTYSSIMLNGRLLKIIFDNLSGTYDGDFIEFDPGQTVTLAIDNSGIMTSLADFELGSNSGGFVLGASGNSLAQDYYLTLTNDTYGILTGSRVEFEAVLTATDFRDNGTYQMMGQLSAVPVPGALILFGSGLVGLVGLKRKRVRQ